VKLLMVVQGRDAVATRYRALAYLPALEAAGWQIQVEPHGSSLADRLRIVAAARRADLVFVQKKRLPGWQLRLMKGHGAPLVYDVDDAVMLRSSRHATRRSFIRERRFAVALRHADLVLAGNPYLAERIREQHRRVVIQPLPFDLERLPRRRSWSASGHVVVGWIGGGKSLPFLRSLGPVFQRLARRHPELQLAIVCDRFFELEGVRILERRWSPEREGLEVASFHVGLAPLPDDEWASGKCGTKLLQCFSAAVPVVASPVGVHREMIEPGVSGFLASSHEEWEAALEKLIGDESLRARMGEAGYAYAREHHALPVLAERFRAHLESLLAGGAGGAP